MKKSNVVVLAVWKQERGIPYKPTFYKENAKILLFPTKEMVEKRQGVRAEKKKAA